MLPSAARLRRRSEFARVYGRGRSYATDLVVVYVLPGRGENTRVGFSISSKLGKSAARNRLRRRLREVVRSFLPSIKGRYDVVVVARQKCADVGTDDLYRTVEEAFRRSGLIQSANQ